MYAHGKTLFMLYRLTCLSILVVALAAVPAPGQRAAAATFQLSSPNVDVVGATGSIHAEADDTLVDVARRQNVGYQEIVLANPGVDPWVPGAGTQVLLPTRFILPPGPREGLIINLPEYRLYYFPETKPGEKKVVITHPISIGRMDWATPLGKTRVVTKVTNPVWYPPESIRREHAEDGRPLRAAVPPGPDNPLGKFAMRLGIPGYLIHGTNKPAGVGMRVTHGCIRMFPEDIEALFAQIPVDAPVRIINQPVKVGWSGDLLLLEVHPPLEGDEERMAKAMTLITEALVMATKDRRVPVDWDKAMDAYESPRGIPELFSVTGPAELLAKPEKPREPDLLSRRAP